jgi:hypothetical protein
MMRVLAALGVGIAGVACLVAACSDGDGENGGSAGSGSVPKAGVCVKGCTMAAECCSGQPGCPGGKYPNNPTCQNGACYPPQCTGDADCVIAMVDIGDCLTFSSAYGDFRVCAPPCTMDSDCKMGPVMGTCTGLTSKEGKKTCDYGGGTGGGGSDPGCKTNSDCMGDGVCENGDCVCHSDADCTDPDTKKCFIP